MNITLVICAYNEENYLGTCLEQVITHNDGYIHEIIVVDNASTDKTFHLAQEYAKKHPLIKVVTEPQKGLTKARQKGYKQASHDIIAYIDADTKIPAGRTKKIANHFKNEKIGFVSGPYSYYDSSWLIDIGNWVYWKIFAFPLSHIVGYVGVGGNFAMRKSVLDNIGGFDTSIAFYGEDTDIARRAHQVSKTVFDLALTMPTSGRRFVGQGILTTLRLYVSNFFSEVIRKKPTTDQYTDFR